MRTPTVQYKLRTHTRLIILHDSHSKPDIPNIVSWLRWKGRALHGLMDIGYHFVIDRDGNITETRPQALIGTHCRGHDLDSIAICLVGGMSLGDEVEDNFTPDQRTSLFDLVRKLKRQYPGVSFVGHYEMVRAKDTKHRRHVCPSCDMHDLRDDYLQYVRSGGITE